MQPSSEIDTLVNSSSQGDNLSWVTVTMIFGLGLLLWILVRYRNKSASTHATNVTIPKRKLSYHQVTVLHDTPKKVDSTRPQKSQSEKGSKLGKIAPKKVEADILEVPEPSKLKYIGYKPVNIFEQTEPMHFPYVLMPKENCVVKFPRKGRSGRKGYKEDDFHEYLRKYFTESFQLFNDRFILIKGSSIAFEPDFTLIDERNGLNIFLDIEIDEPYEGINDIQNRKPTHFQFADTNRNNAFKNRGWIVIRFAEIQVHQNPEGCCLFIADVLKTINTAFRFSFSIFSATRIASVRQWTKEEALQMSREKFREKYLGIANFGLNEEGERYSFNETKLGQETEAIVTDDPVQTAAASLSTKANPTYNLIENAILNAKFISFDFNGRRTILKPSSISNGELKGYCYVKNFEITFPVRGISNPILKESPFTLEAKGPNLGFDRVKAIVNTAIVYNKYIRIRYTRSAWTAIGFDENNEAILNVTEAEESIRTICNVQLSINALDRRHIEQYNLNENYITAFCNKRNDQRTFRFDRISELGILDL